MLVERAIVEDQNCHHCHCWKKGKALFNEHNV